jgi:1-acyl-sn-glycerol-3-phosphate acyltransferase
MRANGFYRGMRGLIGLALGFYFRRIERFHAERVPAVGPVLFTSNHPNSLTDSFVIGASVPRKVNFVATVQLFRFAPLKWLLTRCGVIPINRVRDDPRAMRTVADTFEACYRVLEAGEAVGIFPEGITYEDDQLKEVKSGAARMALELEHRHGGHLGLRIVPVGLTYSAKEIYRSDVLASFGEPIVAAEFLEGYGEHRRECISRLTTEIQRRLEGLLVHLPQLEHARVVAGVKRVYLDHLRLGNSVVHEPVSPRAEELLLSQKIVEVVDYVYRSDPERAAAFAAELDLYERWLRRLRLRDEDVEVFEDKMRLAQQSLWGSVVAMLGAPVAVYGWLHRALPFAVVRWAEGRFAQPGKRKAQSSTVVLLAGVVAFGLFYGTCVLVFHQLFGWPASLWYAVSLPVASLVAHYYWVEVRRWGASLRTSLILIRAPLAAGRLLAMRGHLVNHIEVVRAELRSRNAQA